MKKHEYKFNFDRIRNVTRVKTFISVCMCEQVIRLYILYNIIQLLQYN